MLSLMKSELQTHSTIFSLILIQKLADDIPTVTRSFESCVQKTNERIKDEPITIYEPKDVFFPVKINESAGYDEISSNVIKTCFGKLCDPLKYIFNLSFEKGAYPDYVKIANVTPVFLETINVQSIIKALK